MARQENPKTATDGSSGRTNFVTAVFIITQNRYETPSAIEDAVTKRVESQEKAFAMYAAWTSLKTEARKFV